MFEDEDRIEEIKTNNQDLGNENKEMIIIEEKKPREEKKKTGSTALNIILVVAFLGLGIGLGFAFGRNVGFGEAKQEMVSEALTEEEIREIVKDMEEKGELDIEDTKTVKEVVSTDKNFKNESGTISEVFKKASPSVVSINIKGQATNIFNQVLEIAGAGSGIVYSEDDDKIYIITNYHVIEDANEATISFDDEVQVPAHFIGEMQAMDLALIGVNKTDLKEAGIEEVVVADFADSSEVSVGDSVLAIGNALGQGKTATYGIVSALDKSLTTNTGNQVEAIQIDAAINEGNSGGALVDSQGNVIGVNTAKLASAKEGIEGMGFAIPSNIVIDIANQILETGEAGYPFLGVTGGMVTEQIKEWYNLPSTGFLVDQIYAESTAHLAGIEGGDIITSINGEAIESVDQLRNIVNTSKVGDNMTFTLLRQGENGFTEMELEGIVQSMEQETRF